MKASFSKFSIIGKLGFLIQKNLLVFFAAVVVMSLPNIREDMFLTVVYLFLTLIVCISVSALEVWFCDKIWEYQCESSDKEKMLISRLGSFFRVYNLKVKENRNSLIVEIRHGRFNSSISIVLQGNNVSLKLRNDAPFPASLLYTAWYLRMAKDGLYRYGCYNPRKRQN